MLRGFFLLLVLTFTLLPACSSDVAGGGAADVETCDDVNTELSKERTAIQSCTADSECGQELKGTSCGCTNNLVARTNADVTRFNDLLDRADELQCDLGSGSCDCPAADGFVCKNGACAWNYTGL